MNFKNIPKEYRPIPFWSWNEKLDVEETREQVRKMNEAEIDFSMNANLDEFKTEKNTWLNCMFSKTELWFYIPLALVSTGIIILSALL